ncbi:hypothetical protein F2Q69_00046212 [Brassica cretica]|uniref:Uncharacterized protein n=1 Tax=Brassica cretica TaxID=69181 RepID=A0A8S9PTC5_BRACR|nr:hypothetical protein F2Q69_00046212 [Brassica cretica]
MSCCDFERRRSSSGPRMVVSDFSVGKLDLPQISEDLPEDFFAKFPSAADDVTKCSGGQFEDGEFGIEE